MMTTNDWERWQESWRGARATPADLEGMLGLARRARRAMVLMRVLSLGMAVLALSAVGFAMRHAANPFEAALGLLVGIGIAVAWTLDAMGRDRASDGVEAAPAEYLAVRRTLCARQLRFVRLGLSVALLELAFLTPWWIGGIPVHGLGFSPGRILTFWGPLASILAFIAWMFRLRARARAELARLPKLEDASRTL